MLRHLLSFWKLGLALLVVTAAIVAIAFWPPPEETASSGLWTCSMHPQIRLPAAGSCPICGMDLIPAAQFDQEQARIHQQAGIETEPVAYRALFKDVRTVGKLDYAESQVAYISARVDGRVDRIYADFTGIKVKRNDHLVDLYSPSLFVAQAELQHALEASRRGRGDRAADERLLDAAREKMRLLGILPQQLKEIEASGKPATHLTIYSPIGGTVVVKNVREGQYVDKGDMLYRIADFDPIWLYLDVYEYDLGWIRYGQNVDVSVEAYPAASFGGKVTFIDPFLDDKTRTVKVRVNLPNPDRRLKPSMYASAKIHVRLQADGTPEPTGLEGKYICPMHPEVVSDKAGRCPQCEMPLERVPEAMPVKKPAPEKTAIAAAEHGNAGHDHADHNHSAHETPKPAEPPKPGQVLAVRSSAVLDTGRRKIVYRQNDDGALELVEVEVGPRAESSDESGRTGSFFPVFSGLKAGDKVVVRGGFLLDSQRQIEGMPSLIYPQGQSAAQPKAGHQH